MGPGFGQFGGVGVGKGDVFYYLVLVWMASSASLPVWGRGWVGGGGYDCPVSWALGCKGFLGWQVPEAELTVS